MDLMRPLLYAIRLPLILAHLVVGVPIALIFMSRWLKDVETSEGPMGRKALRIWSKGICRIFGVRVEVQGAPLDSPVMLVANHTTWLDIETISAVRPAAFVAKAEIRSWPIVGWLATRGGSIYHERGDRGSLARTASAVHDKLASGGDAAIFPEGRVGPSGGVLKFHGRLMQPALDANVPVQPVGLRYRTRPHDNDMVSFIDDESFGANVWRVLGNPVSTATVIFLEPVPPQEGGRKAMATEARRRIVDALGYEQ